MRGTFAGIVAVVAAAALLTGPAASAPRSATVVLRDIEFKPGTVSVARGGTVTWKWDDGYSPHDVTSRGKLRFRSEPDAKTEGTHRVRFTKAGRYAYVCTIHLGMRGVVVVR